MPEYETPRIETQGLTRRYGGSLAVSELSLSLHAGRVTCLLGPSGCGKTTTLRMIAGVEEPDAGVVKIDGNIVSGNGHYLPPEQRSVGLLFQDFALFPHLTVAENVAFGVGRNQRERVERLIEKVGLGQQGKRYPHEISGGEQQRAALARALAPGPGAILLDEPFSNLDNRLRDRIRDDMMSVLKSEGTAVLLVTHDPLEAMVMADEIALMRDGRIVQAGPPLSIYNRPVDRQAAEFFSDINLIHGVAHDAIVDTPFGTFEVPGVADGTNMEVMVRPQHMRIDFDRNGNAPLPTERDGVPARGTVKRARYAGNSSLVEFEMEHDGSILKASVPAVFLPSIGSSLWLSIRRDRCFLFPCVVQDNAVSRSVDGTAKGRTL